MELDNDIDENDLIHLNNGLKKNDDNKEKIKTIYHIYQI